MSWYNIFSICYGKDNFEEDERSIDNLIDDSEKLENTIVLVRFHKDCIEFLVSEDGENFSFIPSKIIEEIKLTWFDDDKPKHILFNRLSKLSEGRKVFHKPEYFVNRIRKVYFRYENLQIVPYRYSINKQK